MQLIKDNVDLSGYFEEELHHNIKSAGSWVDEVIDHFYKPQEAPRVKLPWRSASSVFHFRAGEVTLWAGINGHGKSMVTSQVAMHLCGSYEKVCIASLEMPPSKTMARMSRQAFGSDEPTVSFIKSLGDWSNDKLWIYDHVGSTDPKTMLAVIRYAVDKFGITHFVVDNLMKVVAGEDNYNEQKDFVNGLCTIAKDTGCHIHLVLHIKKLKDEETVPNKFDIKGSGAISDLVDNVFIVYRNKKKENKIRNGGMPDAEESDAMLLIEKQRNADNVDSAVIFLWFDHKSMQYRDDRHEMPTQMRIEKMVSYEEVEF